MASQDKRYQVFVSSTYMDLLAERQAVTSALLQLDAFPSGMELFPAADDDAWTLIERVIDDCDYYLLIIGGKYGSINPDFELSYTEREYDYAVSRAKPVMAFLHGNPETLPVSSSEINAEARAKLEAFSTKVRKAKHVKYWVSAEDLAGKVALSFAQFTKQYPSVGWVSADQLASAEVLAELNDLRKKVAELEGQLQFASSGPPPGTENLAAGQERFEFMALAEARGQRRYSTYGKWFHLSATWDEIFASMAPRLLNEGNQEELREALNDYLRINRWLSEGIAEKLVSDSETGGDPKKLTGSKLNVADDDFETILVQLVALGLIRKGVKRRSVTDTNTYWTTTAWGENQALKLRAIRSMDEEPPF
jgi:hypothetical protein